MLNSCAIPVPSAFNVTICLFHTVTLFASPERWEWDQTLATVYSERKACSANSNFTVFAGGDDDKEDSVEEMRKFKKSRKQKKVMVMCDG